MAKPSSRRAALKKKVARASSGRGAARVRAKRRDRTNWVYNFGNGSAEGRADMRDLLGGKGAGLAEMANLGLPVPPGFTITTTVCGHYYENGKTYPKDLEQQVAAALAWVGRITGKTFGDRDNPLLVS